MITKNNNKYVAIPIKEYTALTRPLLKRIQALEAKVFEAENPEDYYLNELS